MIEENIITAFLPKFGLGEFYISQRYQTARSKTSVLFASAYLVPDTSAVYYPPNKSNWVCVSTSDFFRKEHLVLCQGVFLRGA